MCDCQEHKAAAAPAYKPVDLTKPVQTRDGRAARILCTDREHFCNPVVALVKCHDFQEHCYTFSADGRYLAGLERDLDLVNVTPKVVSEVYLNIYRDGVVGAKFTTKAAAQREASPSAIGIIKLTTFDDGSSTFEKVEV